MQYFVSMIMIAIFSSFGTLEMEGHVKWIALFYIRAEITKTIKWDIWDTNVGPSIPFFF